MTSQPACPEAERRNPGPGVSTVRLFWGVTGAALVLRWIALWGLQATTLGQYAWGDGEVYLQWAGRIASGEWWSGDVFYQAPLYPYFLAILISVFGDGLTVLRGAQAVCGALGCGALAVGAQRLVGCGWLTGWLVACYPVAIYLDLSLQKSVLDGALLGLWLACLGCISQNGRATAWLGAGATFGLLMLTRENIAPLGVCVLLWPFPQPRWQGRLLFVCACLMVLFPVALRNRMVGGEWHLTTSQLGTNLYIGNNPLANGTYSPLLAERSNAAYERDDARTLAEEAVGHALTPGEVSRYWVRQVQKFAAESPGQFCRLLVWKWGLTWNALEIADSDEPYSWGDVLPVYGIALRIWHFGILVPLALIGLLITRPTRAEFLLLTLALVYALTVAAFYVFGRYRYPLVPLLMPLAAKGLLQLGKTSRVDWIQTLRMRRGQFALAAVVAAAAITNWPMFDAGDNRAITWLNLGQRLLIAEKPQEARGAFLRSVEIKPDFALAYARLALAEWQLGQPQEADVFLAKSLQLDPELDGVWLLRARWAEARQDLVEAARSWAQVARLRSLTPAETLEFARCCRLVNQSAAAIPFLEQACRLEPKSVELWNELGIARALGNDLRNAAAAFEQAAALDPSLGHLVNVARARAGMGDVLGAISHLTRARALAKPGTPEFEEILALERELKVTSPP